MPFMRTIRPRTEPRANRLTGDDLDALRIACFLRDKGKCTHCGQKLYLKARFENDPAAYDMAHKRGKRNDGDTLENVAAECHACHSDYHAYGPSRTKPCPAKERAS